MVKNEMSYVNPPRGVVNPKLGQHLPKNIDIDEVNQLFDIKYPLSVRNRAILEVMHGSGLRLSELVNIDCRELNLREGGVPLIKSILIWIFHIYRQFIIPLIHELKEGKNNAFLSFN